MKAFKERCPGYSIAVFFQPHTFSRTKALLSEFARAFKRADKIYLAPTYSSAREKREGTENLDEILYENVKKQSQFCAKGIPKALELFSSPGKKIIITMGAGDVWQTAKKLAKAGFDGMMK